MDRTSWLRARFGPDADKADLPILEAARAAAIEVNLPIITRVPNTANAHRLLHWAGIEGLQTRVMDALLRAYWKHGQDIGNVDVLVAIASQSGLDGKMIGRLLATDADRDTIAAQESHARDRGITMVPTFILDNTHVITGAQPAKLWMQVIDEIAAQ